MRQVGMVVLVLLMGCEPELGQCNQPEALRIAYNGLESINGEVPPTGMPAYEGQAVLIQSCGYAGFCHAPDPTTDDDRAARFGAPAGLTFDVDLAAPDGTVDEARVARQRRARFRVVQEARGILYAIDSGFMPPYGDATNELFAAAPRYVRTEGGETVGLPYAETPEGREILRNWLACGAPVVERAAPRDDGVSSVTIPPLEGLDLPPIEPNWPSIYTNLIVGRGCARSLCHGADPDAGFRTSNMDETYDALVNRAASGSECDSSMRLIDADGVATGNADASLFFQKLAGTATCGDPMPSGGLPLRETELDTLRDWIEAGAPRAAPMP